MPKTDIRIIKTQRNIKHAFRQLLKNKNYEEISVQDILDLAEINRTTFYKHYANKDSLAAQLIDEFKQQIFIPLLNKRFSSSAKEFTQYIAKILFQVKEELNLLWKIETRKLHLKQDMYLIIKQKYIEEIEKFRYNYPNTEINPDYQGHMFAAVALASLDYGINSLQDNDPQYILANLKMVFDILIH